MMTQSNRRSADLLRAFRKVLPNDSQTAVVIDGGAPVEIIRVFASSEGFDELAKKLFELEKHDVTVINNPCTPTH